jgi:hypothetical protein
MPIKKKFNNFDKFVSRVDKKALQFTNAVLSVGANYSKMAAPVAYSTLVNSQKTTVTVNGEKITGTLGFYTEYARHLELSENWSPKKPPKYGNKKQGRPPARAWNPNAKPHFLRDGFESTAAKNDIEAMRSIFKF